MRLAVSNIAWTPQEQPAIYPMLAAAGVGGLEIAPQLAFSEADDPFRPSRAEIDQLREQLRAHGLRLVSMQSLLFGMRHAQLFGDAEARAAFEAGVERALALAERLEIPNLVLGAPANRSLPDGMDWMEAVDTAAAVFRRLGDRAQAAGSTLALEPNPSSYGCNFLTSAGEAISFAFIVGHAAVTVNFDFGALHANGEANEAAALYRAGAAKISHVHVSEPGLGPAPRDEALFGRLARQLIRLGYAGWFSIEMRSGVTDNRAAVSASIAACARQLALQEAGAD
jgi:sugar phosphate isomerase/epimerase